MSSGSESPDSRGEQSRGVIWGALLGLVVIAIVIAALGSPLGALIPLAIAAFALLLFFGGLG